MKTEEKKAKKLNLAVPIVLLILFFALSATAAQGIGILCGIFSVVTFLSRRIQNWEGYGATRPATAVREGKTEGWGEEEFLEGPYLLDDPLLGSPKPTDLSVGKITL